MPGEATPNEAAPSRTLRNVAALYHHSQVDSRQLGGMTPSFNALAIMPLCLGSALRTWHLLQRVRRLLNSFEANLPLRIWSMLHPSRVTGEPQWTHLRPSRSQIVSRRLNQMSRGGLCLGIFLYVKREHFKPSEADGATIAKTREPSSIDQACLHFVP